MYSFCRCFRGQPGKNTSSQDPPLDESKEKRLRLPSPKERNGRVGVSGYRLVFVSGYRERARQRMGEPAPDEWRREAIRCGRDAPPLHRFASSPLPLYTPLLWRQINRFMEVDFQAIKLEELKSRLGELRRYL